MFLLIIPFFLFALNLEEILNKPKSYVRDFYLTEFMKETNSTILAYKAYNSLYKKKVFTHLRILAKKDEKFEKIYKCINVKKEYFKEVDISCILENGLSLGTIATLSKKDLNYLYNNLTNGKVKKAVKVLLDNDFSKVFKDRDLGYYFILHYPTRKIDQMIDDFSLFMDKYFYLFVRSAVINNLNLIRLSLTKINYKKLDDKAKWWLFLNEMKFKNYDKAFKVLKSIKNKNSKIYFWLWQLSNKQYYLDKLLNNPRIDFYTLYAHEEKNVSFDIMTNILFNTVKNPKYDQTNPWDVLKFFNELKKRKDLFNFAKELDSNKSIALKAIVLDKANNYSKNYFIIPDIYKDKNNSFRAFVYAIARQESRFVPASVSSSYALGTMQIMPFLVKELKGDIFKQFDYNENVKIGAKHLKWLFKQLHHPLMVAYAYNGGIGFVKNRVLPTFKFKGRYEPFLSMELIPYYESREYAKKVIANYVIYSKIFNSPITLHSLLSN